MSSLSLFKAIPLLLFTLPTSILSAPAAVSNSALISRATQYKIRAATFRSAFRNEPTSAGDDNKLDVTVTGLQEGNINIHCSGEWFYDYIARSETRTALDCVEDKAVKVTVTQGSESEAFSIGVAV
ncbi:MAG: hypothetical protein Q9226_006494 [Calogaya cf. arnoldii]